MIGIVYFILVASATGFVFWLMNKDFSKKSKSSNETIIINICIKKDEV